MAKEKKKKISLLEATQNAAKGDCLDALKKGDMSRARDALDLSTALKRIEERKASLPYYGEFIGE